MNAIDELKKSLRVYDLAAAFGRKKQSPRTGFVHLFPTDETASDTIPVYENFCFAFALFRQRTAESVLEGKEIIERLLSFQTEEGNFPVYLHDFPRCWDFQLPLKIAPVLIHLLREFPAVLGEAFKDKLTASLQKALQFSSKRRPLPPMWEARFSAANGILPQEPELSTPQDWFEWMVTMQLINKEAAFAIPYNRTLQLFLGCSEIQEKGEPQPLAIELILAEKEGIGSRLSRCHLNQLYAALLYSAESTAKTDDSLVSLPRKNGGLRIFWGGEMLHSLASLEGKVDGNQVTYSLPSEIEFGRDDVCEAALFCDVSPETAIYINGSKGMVFHFGDLITIETPERKIGIRFELLSGAGDYCGHISRANRPGQTAAKGANLYEAYDWRIALRTLRRNGAAEIAAHIEIMQ